MPRQVGLVLVVALALRLITAVWLDRQWEGRFAFGDSESYWVLAGTIAQGEAYQFGSPDAKVFRTPGYPLLLAPVFLLGGDAPSRIWGRVLGAVFGVLSVLGVWWLGRILFGDRAAVGAAVAAACYPEAVATSVLVLSEAPFCPWMLAHLGLWMASWRARGLVRGGLLGFAAGLAAGVATLVRPSWLLFTPFALLIGLAAGAQRRRQLGLGLAMLAGLCAVMAPWWVRNARLTGHFVATTLQVGASLYDGLNPAATGASNMDFVAPMTDAARKDFQAGHAPGESFEYYLDRRFLGEAVAWACDKPGQVARLALAKLARLWNLWPNEPRFSAWPGRLVVLVTYLPALVLGVVGAWKTIHRGWPYVLCWLPAVYFSLLHMLFVSSLRYRQPAMLTLMVLAAGVVANHQPGRVVSDRPGSA